jgi:hypothetical protein
MTFTRLHPAMNTLNKYEDYEKMAMNSYKDKKKRIEILKSM